MLLITFAREDIMKKIPSDFRKNQKLPSDVSSQAFRNRNYYF